MFPSLQVGPLAIQVPGLLLLLGLWLGLSLAERRAPRHGVDPGSLYNLVLVALLAGVAGARFGYFARFPAAFMASPASIISLNPGLLDLSSGLAAYLLAAMIYGQRKKLPFWQTLDALSPLLAALGVAFGFAHLASGDAFGMPSELPWAIEMWGARRHPTQVYEIILAILILLAVYLPRKASMPPGTTILTFIALASAARLFVEGFRGDSVLVGPGLRLAQISAWIGLATSLVLLGVFRYARKSNS